MKPCELQALVAVLLVSLGVGWLSVPLGLAAGGLLLFVNAQADALRGSNR